MAKIYDANGNKMNVTGICAELVEKMTYEQKQLLAKSVAKYEYDNSQMKLAHGILDIYKDIDGTNEQGMRIRKLLDNLMTKYQKSSPANAEDQAVYHNFIGEISK
jgi:hypothetical protein